MSIYLAEAVGMAILILLGDGVVANALLPKSKGQNAGWMVITTGWAIAVTIAIYAVGRISGAHLNPAVTVALASIGSFAWADVPGYVLAQMIGAIVGATLVWLAYLPHWAATTDRDLKRAAFCTGPAIDHPVGNVITETIGAAMLVFGVLAIAANAQTLTRPGQLDLSVVFSSGIQPMLVGALVLGIGVSLGGPTGYAINPARDLGPRLAHAILPIAGKGHSDWGYAWIPVIAPVVGGVLGAQLFRVVGF